MNEKKEKEMIKEFIKTFLSSIKKNPNFNGYSLDGNEIKKFLIKYFPERDTQSITATYILLRDFISKYSDIFQLYGISVNEYGGLYYNNSYTPITVL
jgi:hypothetical protein